jgi:hypothetical protein
MNWDTGLFQTRNFLWISLFSTTNMTTSDQLDIWHWFLREQLLARDSCLATLPVKPHMAESWQQLSNCQNFLNAILPIVLLPPTTRLVGIDPGDSSLLQNP